MKTVLSLCCMLLSTAAFADVVLNVNANRTIQQVVAGQTISLQTSSVAEKNAAGWQLNLQIIRESGVGEISFTAPALPTSNYFLGGEGQGILSFTPTSDLYPNDRLKILDFDGVFPIAGVNIVDTKNLVELNFDASSDANGVFGIYLLDRPGFLSEWTEIDNGLPQSNRFAGLDSRPTMLRLGEITAVPEPSAIYFFTLLTVIRLVTGRLTKKT